MSGQQIEKKIKNLKKKIKNIINTMEQEENYNLYILKQENLKLMKKQLKILQDTLSEYKKLDKTWNNCPYCIKVCTKCNRILVAYGGNFGKDKKKKYGLKAKCKECVDKEKIKQYNPYDNIDTNKTWNNCPYCIKVCYKCKRILVANSMNFNKKKGSKYGLRGECKRCVKEYQEELKTIFPEVFFNANNKRRLREENQGNGITKEQWLEMMEFFNWCCAYSGITLNKDTRTIDHIVPLAEGGLNEIWNLVPMYRNYNSSKKTSNMLQWYEQQDFYSDERLEKIYAWCEYAYNKWYSEQII